MSVPEFFRPWEKVIQNFDAINEVIESVFKRWISQGSQFAWRGVVDASFPLHGSLYRRVLWTPRINPRAPDERDLARVEGEVLARAHRWGLHYGSSGRLPILAQLATLQHFGAPTRLIDVSLNAYIGLWFAVEQKYDEYGNEIHGDDDGRLFAIDITRRLINEDSERRPWEDALSRPWKRLDSDEWSSKTWAWKPAPFEARIASQHGAFLLGGVPRTGLGVAWPKGPGPNSGNWRIDDVRQCTSLPLRFHKAQPEGGGVREDGQPAYTFRIRASAKGEIRDRLGQLFGYSHHTMYPDYPGFAQFGMPHLPSKPPVPPEAE